MGRLTLELESQGKGFLGGRGVRHHTIPQRWVMGDGPRHRLSSYLKLGLYFITAGESSMRPVGGTVGVGVGVGCVKQTLGCAQ